MGLKAEITPLKKENNALKVKITPFQGDLNRTIYSWMQI